MNEPGLAFTRGKGEKHTQRDDAANAAQQTRVRMRLVPISRRRVSTKSELERTRSGDLMEQIPPPWPSTCALLMLLLTSRLAALKSPRASSTGTKYSRCDSQTSVDTTI